MIKSIIIILVLILVVWFSKEVLFVSHSVANISANEVTTLASCKVIYEACNTYRQAKGEYPKSLSILGSEKPPYIQNDLAEGIRSGYEYSYEKTATGFFVNASPLELDKTGRFYFSVD